MTLSQNGWPANDISLTTLYRIPGTNRSIRLAQGAAGEMLVDFFSWFHQNVEPIDEGTLDDWGYAERNVRGSDTVVSNHASGTAGDMNSLRHPLGQRGTFTPAQERLIRTRLLRYYGCIRWGGDYRNRADEMHFEIDKDRPTVERVWASLRKDWLEMATYDEVVQATKQGTLEALREFFRDSDGGAPDIGRARVIDPDDPNRVLTVAHLLYGAQK